MSVFELVPSRIAAMLPSSRMHEYIPRAGGKKSNGEPLRHMASLALANSEDETEVVFYGRHELERGDATGLAEYYGTTDPTRAQNAVNVIDGGGVHDANASIYVIGWGESAVYIARSMERGNLTCAVIPEDWRYAVRIANIDLETAPDIRRLLNHALVRLPTTGTGRPTCEKVVIYMNDDVNKELARQCGIPVPVAAESDNSYRKIPIVVVAALHRKEPRVV